MSELTALLGDIPLQQHLYVFLLGSVRIMIFASLVPFLGPQVAVTVLFPIVLALYVPLHPLLLAESQASAVSVSSMDWLHTMLLVCKELAIGFVLAYICSCIFYAVLAAGVITDNQRGASMAQSSDPMAGAESSPLGTVMLLAMVTLFFTSGAFLNFMSIFWYTYSLWSPFEMLPGLLYPNTAVFALQSLDTMMLHALLICAPFVLVALLCDLALGLINRFAPQLNVFILSMPIKSGVCALLIIFYLGPFLNHADSLFVLMNDLVLQLRSLWGSTAQVPVP